MIPFSRSRSPIPAAMVLVGAGLFLACQDPGAPSYFGRWDEAHDGGQNPSDAASADAALPTPDAATRTCTPSEIGGGDDLRGLLATRSLRQGSLQSRGRPTSRATGRTTGREVDDDDDKYVVADARCLSGWRWIGGQHESKLMQPGSDCLRCHRPGNGDDSPGPSDDDDEAPGYVVAGTVYGALNEPSDCLGVEGVTLRITDARGQRIERTSNRAGNFYIKSKDTRLALPFTAELSASGRTRRMQHAECLTSCNVCHSPTGHSGAPGRLLLP